MNACILTRHARRTFVITACIAMCAALAAPLAHRAAAAQFDLLLRGATIVDGSGGKPYRGDVAVKGDRIVAVGDVDAGAAGRTIDCEGLVLCPGFIDLHNHSDASENGVAKPENRNARCYLTQGCTTLVTGNCGGGREDVGAFYDELAEARIGINVAHLAPHGAMRDKVMGKVRRAPSAKELKQLKELAAVAMAEGAWGMSTGLQYVPGAYADTDELVAIAAVVGERGGIYASHIRDESDQLLESIEEVLEIARRANVPCHVSHLKSSRRPNWGKMRAATQLIEQARGEGLRVTADQYPYIASSTSIMAMLLSDAEREGGEEQAAKRLSAPAERERLRPMVAKSLEERGQIMIARSPKHPQWVGRMISDIAEAEGRPQAEIGLDILTDHKAQGVNFGMDEADVRYAMTFPWVATASDGSVKVDDGTRPHPRSFGTFPRKIGRYAIQEDVLPLEQAVRSASGLPADIIGMSDRGYVRENLAADLVVFDPDKLIDRATFDEPFQISEGVRWLLVNGQIAIDDGQPTDALAGRALRRILPESGAAGQ